MDQLIPVFPGLLHQNAAKAIAKFFEDFLVVDTFLVVNSCARGHATDQSDIDFAVLLKPETSNEEFQHLESKWLDFLNTNMILEEFRRSGRFSLIHLDIINGQYELAEREPGQGCDFFEIEIGNQIQWSAPMGTTGKYFQQLQKKWRPFYSEELRNRRLVEIRQALEFDLEHIPVLVERGLHFHALDILYRAFQEFLQLLFITRKTYPIAYNKWIKWQVETVLALPDLYRKLPFILAVSNLESDEVCAKSQLLKQLTTEYCGYTIPEWR
jgi:predicted nucleotidyltransferase